MKAIFLVSMAGALALAACGDAESDTTDAMATDAAVQPTAEAEIAPDTSTPQGFVEMAASSDMYEVEAGKLAQQMGTDDAIKSFGRMMERDHTDSTAKLHVAVGEAGEGLTVPAAMQPKHRQLLEELRAAGANFDSLYAQQQAAAHEEALALMQAQAANGTSAPLKAHAAATAPIIEDHLRRARELATGAAATN